MWFWKMEPSDQWETLRSHRGRKQLRSSVDNNAMRFVVQDGGNRRRSKIQRTKSKSELQTHPSMVAAWLRREPELGKGAFSVAHTLSTVDGWDVAVGLLKAYERDLLGSMASPYFGVNACSNIAQLLWLGICEPHYSPHLITPWFNCVGYGTARQHETRGAFSVIQFSERALHGTVRSYITSLSTKRGRYAMGWDGPAVTPTYMARLVRVILFQVAYTLDAIHQVFPRFRHNDLRDENVLMQVGPPHGTKSSYTSRGMTWHIPNMGVNALISDYDVSTIPGLQDNYITLENEFTMPLLYCDTRQDHGADLFVFASCLFTLIHDKVDPGFRDQLQRIWNGHLGKFTSRTLCMRHPDIRVMRQMPSAFDVLTRSHLFSEFEHTTPRNGSPQTLYETYAVPLNVKKMTEPPVELQSPDGPREAGTFTMVTPLFSPRADARGRFPVGPPPYCYRYLDAKVPTDDAVISQFPQGISTTYVYVERKYTPVIAARLDQLWFQQSWGPPHLAVESVEATGKLVVDATIVLGARFLNHFVVPMWWWPAVFIMAYRDTLTHRNLRRPEGQGPGCSWVMEHYAEWWLNFSERTPLDDWVTFEADDIHQRALQLLNVAQQWSWWRGRF